MPGRRRRPGYTEWITTLCDRGSWTSWADEPSGEDPLGFDDRLPEGLMSYRRQLATRRASNRCADAVISGTATIGGHPVALLLSDYSFLAGTMGVATADRVSRAFDRALELGLPMVALVASAGVRMQEGPMALMQMTRAGAAAARFRHGGHGYFVYLGDPSMGGVLASWGGLATMTFGAPGALLGVTGPRIVSLATGKQSPATVPEHTEEWLRRGLLDDVVTLGALRARLQTLLGVLAERTIAHEPQPQRLVPAPVTAHDQWSAVVATRSADHPAARLLVESVCTEASSLRGVRRADDDPSLRCLVGRLCGRAVVVIAHERWSDGRRARVGVSGYVKARRTIAVANELRLPIVTMIDTPGPDDSGGPTAASLAYEIAALTQDMIAARVPTLALLLGEGGGGAAIAFLAADHVIAARNAWLAPIAPEAASAILLGTPARAAEIARAQRIGAEDLLRLGVVDVVVDDAEPRGDPAARWHDAVSSALDGVTELACAARIDRRLARSVPGAEAHAR
jgi:acetyl-CoA carboxylase carboxyl transferase subunit beta